jgi:MbtH protein
MHEERHVANPFEDENGVFHVLVNDEGQHSLWPSFVEVPSGWTIILKSESRTACLEFIERNWTDMRPKSLIASMAANEQQAAQASEADGAPAGSVKTIH